MVVVVGVGVYLLTTIVLVYKNTNKNMLIIISDKNTNKNMAVHAWHDHYKERKRTEKVEVQKCELEQVRFKCGNVEFKMSRLPWFLSDEWKSHKESLSNLTFMISWALFEFVFALPIFDAMFGDYWNRVDPKSTMCQLLGSSHVWEVTSTNLTLLTHHAAHMIYAFGFVLIAKGEVLLSCLFSACQCENQIK